MVDELTLAIAIIATIPLYIDLIWRYSKSQLQFELERFEESVTSPIESVWSIRVVRPTRTIEHCSIVLQPPTQYSGFALPQQLPIWNKKDFQPVAKISEGGSANFRIPKAINPSGYTVVVKDKDRALRTRAYNDLPVTNA